MKDYRSIFEFQRRKEEFNKYYSASYDTSEVRRILGSIHKELSELLDDPEAVEDFQKEMPFYLPLIRVLALCSYVHKYCSLELAIHSNMQDDEIEELSQMNIDDATMTSGEIYDFLKSLHPSYAEALLSFVDHAGIDVRERLLDFFLTDDKQSFISIIQNEQGNAYRLSHLCKVFQDNDIIHRISYEVNMMAFVEENKTSIQEMPIEEFKEGAKIAKILDLTKLRVENEDEWKEIKRVLEQDSYQYYKLAVIKYIVAANGMLSENQKEQYQELLHADGIAQWYDKAYEECQKELSEEDSEVEPEVNQEQKVLELPEDFLTEYNKYRDNKIPKIPGLQLPSSNEILLALVDMLAEHHCIENNAESKYKFIRAYTGRSISPKNENIFEKALWIGTFNQLICFIKYCASGEKGKYDIIPELFILTAEEEKKFLELSANTQKLSAYDGGGGGRSLKKALNSIFPNKK